MTASRLKNDWKSLSFSPSWVVAAWMCRFGVLLRVRSCEWVCVQGKGGGRTCNALYIFGVCSRHSIIRTKRGNNCIFVVYTDSWMADASPITTMPGLPSLQTPAFSFMFGRQQSPAGSPETSAQPLTFGIPAPVSPGSFWGPEFRALPLPPPSSIPFGTQEPSGLAPSLFGASTAGFGGAGGGLSGANVKFVGFGEIHTASSCMLAEPAESEALSPCGMPPDVL